MSKVSSGFTWLEDSATGDPVGVRRVSDGAEFTLPVVTGSKSQAEAAAAVGAVGFTVKRVLPSIGKPLAAGIDASSGVTSVNSTLSYVSRVAPNGETIRGVKITGNGLASNCSVDIPLTIPSTIPNARASLLIYIPPDTAALVPGMTLYVADAGFTNYFSRNVTISRHGWQQYSPAPASSTYTQKWAVGGGAPVFGTTTFTKSRVRMDFSVGQIPVFEVYAVLEDCGVNPAPICFTFDDGYISQYNLAAPLLERYGLRGSFAVIADLIDSGASYMTWAQLRELRDRGHEINVHGPVGGTGSLLNYSGAADRYQAVYNDVAYHRQRIIDNGCARNGSQNIYVYPQGNDEFANGDTTISDALEALGIKGGRGVDSTRVDMLTPWGGRTTKFSSIIGHSWVSEATEAANIAEVQQRIVDNVSARRPSVMMGHYVVTGTPTQSLEIKSTNLELIFQTAAAQIASGSAVNVTLTGLHQIKTGVLPG